MSQQNIDDINISQDNNFKKKTMSSTTIEKINTMKRPSIFSEESESQKSEQITKIRYMKTEEDFSDLGNFQKRSPKFRIYLSSRYRGPKLKEEISSPFHETENNIHDLNVRKIPINDSNRSFRRNVYEPEREIAKKKI